jgi:chemotaxis protein MotA
MADSRPTREQPRRSARELRIDKGTLLGLLCAAGGMVSGLVMERGALSDVSQLTAALIVFGGTFGAVLIGTPLRDVLGAVRELRLVIFDPGDPSNTILEQLVSFATKARRNGIVSLEADAEKTEDPFLQKAVNLAIDGAELTELRSMMRIDMDLEERRAMSYARVFESAGGYAPTIGIIGAVLGLIQVMKNLANIDEVGRGIAVAFVATIYGVGSANLLFLPAAIKIRAYSRRCLEVMELILEGVSGIVEGMNPKMIRRKLESLAAGGSNSSATARATPGAVPAGEHAQI